jgi:hypothetical protein
VAGAIATSLFVEKRRLTARFTGPLGGKGPVGPPTCSALRLAPCVERFSGGTGSPINPQAIK